MGSYTFRWPHAAEEVIVTGTFDNWQKTVKLDKTDDGGFKKDVPLPKSGEKVYYKFVVDGAWATDHTAPQENDHENNTNNVLLPEQINKTDSAPETTVMSGVTPEATTAKLAGDVPKESSTATAPGEATISSAAPESTTANLAKDVPKDSAAPGGFPETPANEPEAFSVNPIPATAGTGNPVQLKPGEKVPDPSTLTNNTVHSTATTHKEGYEKDASDPAFAASSTGGENVTTLPVEDKAVNGPAEPHIQSAAPTSTTAALAAAVPREPKKGADSETPAQGVPEVVKESLTEAHKDPEAAGSSEAVKDKTAMEKELLKKQPEEDTPGKDVPNVVKESLTQASKAPEAADNPEAVEEKKEVESELLKGTKPDESAGEPAPTTTATTATTAPAHTEPVQKKEQIRELSPKSREPAVPPAEPTPNEPTVTTGPETTTAPETTTPAKKEEPAPAAQAAPAAAAKKDETPTAAKQGEDKKDKKKKNRASGFFSKLKEKLKDF